MLTQQLLLWHIEGFVTVVLHTHSGAGHPSFVSETMPKATYADEFLVFSILIKKKINPIFFLFPHQDEVIKTFHSDGFRSLDSGLDHCVEQLCTVMQLMN